MTKHQITTAAGTVSLKKIQYSSFASQETSCFSAIVCLDGLPIAEAFNEGHGGATFLRHLFEKYEQYEPHEKKLQEVVSAITRENLCGFGERTADAADVVDHLLEKFLEDKEYAKLRKRAIAQMWHIDSSCATGRCFKLVPRLIKAAKDLTTRFRLAEAIKQKGCTLCEEMTEEEFKRHFPC